MPRKRTAEQIAVGRAYRVVTRALGLLSTASSALSDLGHQQASRSLAGAMQEAAQAASQAVADADRKADSNAQ